MPLYKFFAYLYFFCWVFLAFFQYLFYTNLIYEPLLLFFSGSSLYYSFYAITKYNLPVYFKFLFLFVLVLLFYGITLFFLGDDVYWIAAGRDLRKYLYTLWLLSSLLSVVPVYVFVCEGIIGVREMKIIFFVLLGCCIYAFYGSLKEQMMFAVLTNSEQSEFTITCVYSFLSILPLIILFKKKLLLQFFLIALIFAYLVYSSKRGPVILGGISILLLIYSLFVAETLKKKIMILFATMLFLGVIYSFFDYQMTNSQYFAHRVNQTLEGHTSKRDEYVKIVWDYYTNSTNLKEFVFGIGAQGTLRVNESFAHNDWFAILLEQGLFGLFFYSLYWFGFIYTWLKSKLNHEAFYGIALLIVIGFGKTIFSMYYLPISAEMMMSSGYFTISLGYFLAKAYPQQKTYLVNIVSE